MLGSFKGFEIETSNAQNAAITESHTDGNNYFKDGKRKIDFVLAVPRNKSIQIKPYLEQLEKVGLELEIEIGKVIDKIYFIKIHASDVTISDYNKYLLIEFAMNNPNFTWHVVKRSCVFHTDLTCKKLAEELQKRTNLIGVRPTNITNAERILIVNNIMSTTPYNDLKSYKLYGYEHFLKTGIVKAAYPLHDGTWRWTSSGLLNDRQLLYKYWTHIKNYYKYQPLVTVEKYFGTEIGLFFAFLGLYNNMLIPLAILGIIVWCFGFLELFTGEFEEFCNFNEHLCPLCQDLEKCPIRKISDYCAPKAINMLFDNTLNAIFGIIVSIWSLIFLARWRRYENVLKYQWNIHRLKYNSTVRNEYLSEATVVKHSRFTRKLVKEVPFFKRVRGFFMTYISIFVLIVVNYGIIFILMLFQKLMYIVAQSNPNVEDFIVFLASLLNTIFVIAVIKPMMSRLAIRLARNEYHRLQKSFDDSIIYKTCVLTIPSFYGFAFYLALFKGRFFTKPSEVQHWYDEGGIPANECNPAGCLAHTSILMMTMLISSTTIGCFKLVANGYVTLYIKRILYKAVVRKTLRKHKDLTLRWEKDFLKLPASSINSEYLNIMLHYAMLTFFVSTSPLIPAVMCIRNGIFIRLTGYNFLQLKRRPVPKKNPSLGAWNRVLVLITFFGLFTNGLIIAFCTSLIPRTMYFLKNNWAMKGFVKNLFLRSDLSKFSKLKGFYIPKNTTLPETCYFRGYDFIAYAADAHHGNTGYWNTLVITLLFVIVFENIMLVMAALIFFLMPAFTSDLKQQIEKEEKELRKSGNASRQ